jgi:hypothetical protein
LLLTAKTILVVVACLNEVFVAVGEFLWADSYISLVDEDDEWLVEPLIPSGGLVNLYGKPKTAKSFAAIGLALAISTGMSDWNGFPIHRSGPVAYIQIDTPRGEWKRRFRNIADAGYDISKIAIIDLKIAPYPFNILLPQHQTWLKQQLDLIKPVFVVIDTLREAHEGNENDSTDMKKVINTLVKICRPAAIALVSHSRKDSAYNVAGVDSDLMDEGRGSSYVSGRMDTIIKFTGRNGKGNMTYKGRSVEEGKIPILQSKDTGLVMVEGEESKLEAAILNLIHTNPLMSKHSMATALSSSFPLSVKTLERRIEKVRNRVQKSPTVSGLVKVEMGR